MGVKRVRNDFKAIYDDFSKKAVFMGSKMIVNRLSDEGLRYMDEKCVKNKRCAYLAILSAYHDLTYNHALNINDDNEK